MKYQKQQGFTMIELVMVMVIISIISAIVGNILLNTYQGFLTADTITDLDYTGFLALERMSNDFRTASSMTTIASNTVTFRDQAGTSHTYAVTGTTLTRDAKVLIDGLQSLTLSYLDKNGTVTATLTAVDYIKITLALQQLPLSTTFTTLVSLRGVY